MDSKESESRSGENEEVRQRHNGSGGRSSPDDDPDGQSLNRPTSSAILNPGASAAAGATNGYFMSHQDYNIYTAIRDKQEVFQWILGFIDKDMMAVSNILGKLEISPHLTDQGVHDKLLKKLQELERSVTSLRQYGQRIERRLVGLETSYSGVYLWKIADYNERKRDAMITKVKSITSPPFFTSQYSYKLRGRVFLMGDGVGKGTHISLFLTILKGPHDAVLPWPFKERITFQLVNQDDPINKSIVKAFRPDPTSSSFKKPTTGKNSGAGCPLFAKIRKIENPQSGFLRDNTIYLKIVSQTSDVPEIK